jgi:glycosyltransferase involved in cell wall biosynthesis
LNNKRLKIGVDARPLLHLKSGIGRCTISLLECLIDSDHQWFLYSSSPLPDQFYLLDNVVVRDGAIKGGLSGLIYSQFVYPFWAARDKLDAFWSPRHHVPIFLPSNIFSLVSVYDLVWQRFPETMTWFGRIIESVLMPASIKKADCILSSSDYTTQQLQQEFPQSIGRIELISGASSFSIRSQVISRDPIFHSDDSYYLFVGTLEPRKNLVRLLKAYSNYIENNRSPKILKIVGGGGWGGVNVMELSQKLGISNYINVLGEIGDNTLHDVYANAFALIMPSLYEGFGLPVVEAMSMGVPAIVSQDSSMSEVGGSAVATVDPLSVDSIAEKISLLASDQKYWKRLSENTLTEATRFSWKASARKLLDIIEAQSSQPNS